MKAGAVKQPFAERVRVERIRCEAKVHWLNFLLDGIVRRVSLWLILLDYCLTKLNFKRRVWSAAREASKWSDTITVLHLSEYGLIEDALSQANQELIQGDGSNCRLLAHPCYRELWRWVKSLGFSPKLEIVWDYRNFQGSRVAAGYCMTISIAPGKS